MGENVKTSTSKNTKPTKGNKLGADVMIPHKVTSTPPPPPPPSPPIKKSK